MRAYFVSEGRLFLLEDGAVRELPNGILERAVERLTAAARREEWKTTGAGARFLGTEGDSRSAEERIAAMQTAIGGLAMQGDRLAFSLTVDGVSGIYTKRTPDDTDEGILYSHASQVFGDLAEAADGLLLSVAYAGRSHIALLRTGSRSLELLTDGATVDTHPTADPRNERILYFSSAGLAEGEEDEEEPHSLSDIFLQMSRSSAARAIGPAAILRMDLDTRSLSELLSDPGYDYLKPTAEADGSLCYLRRPYRGEEDGSGALGCLTDILLLPWRLLRAIFGFFNFFTLKYSGKPLSRGASAAKHRDERDVFLEGNRFEAERELKRNRNDPYPGIIPRSYELRRRTPEGEDLLLANGVYDYTCAKDGSILYSNGTAILRLAPDGTCTRLADAKRVTRLLS